MLLWVYVLLGWLFTARWVFGLPLFAGVLLLVGLFLGFRLLHSWGVWFLFNFSCCVVCGFDGCLWVHSFVIWVLA